MPSAELLMGMVDTIDCGIVLARHGHGHLQVNLWVQQLAGVPRDVEAAQLGGLGGEDWRRFVANLAAAADAGIQTFELTDSSGRRRVIQATVRPIQLPGDDGSGSAESSIPPSAAHLATLIDMTHRDDAEQRLKELNFHLAALSDSTIEQALGLKDLNEILEKKVEERTIELRQANLAALQMLAIASEARDTDTGAHVRRIQHYVELLATRMGIKESEAKRLGYASILHDVGKIHVPDRILHKPGPLTDDERREMQSHTIIGERILAASVYFKQAAEVARSHHENWNGSGYPDGRRELEIPLGARITHLADVFDALASPRVYKAAWPPEKVVALIREEQGRQFDPEVVAAFDDLVAQGQWKQPGESA